MRLDPEPFVAKAEAAAGHGVDLCVDAKRRRQGDVLGRSGVLCLTENAAVFVEDRILQPGDVHLVRDPRVVATRRDYLGAEFDVRTPDGVVVYAGIDEAQADAVARAFARIALGPFLAEDDEAPNRPITAEVYGEPDDDDLEIEADDEDIEESVELEAQAAVAAAPERIPEQATNRVAPMPVVELEPVVEIEPMPAAPRARPIPPVLDLLLADHLPEKTALEIQWKHDRFVVHGRDFIDGISAGRFGRGTRFRLDGTNEPFVPLGETRIYDLHRPGGDVDQEDEAAEIAALQPTTTWPVAMAGAAVGGWLMGSVTGMIIGLVAGFIVRKPIARLLRM